ncbi:zinc finger bed domain-containing protein ricesleeper 2-like [Gigaspora margarita]|uniref:Zinc finger bed domain-containing protein ricesleeper 2-like n=1 Tax=Gigaspora margarita TaxID=4874 RepID=A0A8H3WWX3_GIGMA|nr:zinc finger bed domain-containing protein ricesleeper 2-like [Gigaspora margarita]
MIERALNLQQALDDLVMTDKSLIKYSLTNNEWTKLEQIKKLLKCFKDATLEISASSYPTLSYTIPIYNYLIDLIEKFLKEESYSNDIINAIDKAKLKLQKYYPTTNGLAYITAAIIDPRLKLDYFKDQDFDEETIEIYQQQIINLWKTKYMPTQNQNNNQATNKSSGLMAYMVKKKRHNDLDELIKFLKEPPSNCDIDILTFWKLHETDYPNLARIARDFLAIPGTSVPVERIFSNSADLISSKRHSLNPETIKICMCLKSWLKFTNEK